jgi:lipoyl(octanoyl) transferase
MEDRVERIASGEAPELIWLLEHPPLYTAGTSANDADLLTPNRFPVYRTGRGGQFTYHGPGQRVVYVMLDLKRRGSDVRAFVHTLEQWLIASLAELGVKGAVRPGRIGVWVPRALPQGNTTEKMEDKIAAIGIRVRRWITFHGVSLNVSPNLEHFDGIVPCGIRDYGVTSLATLDGCTDLDAIDQILLTNFEKYFHCGAMRSEPFEL